MCLVSIRSAVSIDGALSTECQYYNIISKNGYIKTWFLVEGLKEEESRLEFWTPYGPGQVKPVALRSKE